MPGDVSSKPKRIVPAQSVPDSALPQSPSPKMPPPRSFFFVNETSSSKGKRAHVMKNHIQEKKKQKRLLLETAKRNKYRPARLLPLPQGVEPILSREVSVDRNADEVEPKTTVKQALVPEHINCSLCRQITPKADRLDPFDTLPMELTDESQQLVDCWTTKLAYWSGQNTHMKISAFKQAILHPMSFHVMILTYCARYRAHILGLKATPQSAQYISTAERSLARYIENSSDASDENIIMAFAALSLQEERYGDKIKASGHMKQALQRLKPRSGRYKFQDVFVHYVRYTMAPRTFTVSAGDIQLLLSFLRSAESAAEDYKNICQSPSRVTAFRFSAPLHLLLSSGPHPSHVPREERKWVVRYSPLQNICRVASLIYITSSLLDFHGYPDRIKRFLQCTVDKVVQHRLHHTSSAESLIWMLLEEPPNYDLKNNLRPWFVGNIMEIVQKLPEQLHYQFGEILLRYLMLRPTDIEISLSMFEVGLRTLLEPQTITFPQQN